jgi:hypothetical protein
MRNIRCKAISVAFLERICVVPKLQLGDGLQIVKGKPDEAANRHWKETATLNPLNEGKGFGVDEGRVAEKLLVVVEGQEAGGIRLG